MLLNPWEIVGLYLRYFAPEASSCRRPEGERGRLVTRSNSIHAHGEQALRKTESRPPSDEQQTRDRAESRAVLTHPSERLRRRLGRPHEFQLRVRLAQGRLPPPSHWVRF